MRVVGTAVEYLDLYPTLTALALPSGVPAGLEGRSFAHLLDDAAQPHRDVAFYQYTCAGRSSCMGYSVLSVPLRMRYTEWVAFDMESATPDFGTPLAPPELYDHRTDLQEDKNAATNPANAAAKQQLSHALRLNFARPPPVVGKSDDDEFAAQREPQKPEPAEPTAPPKVIVQDGQFTLAGRPFLPTGFYYLADEYSLRMEGYADKWGFWRDYTETYGFNTLVKGWYDAPGYLAMLDFFASANLSSPLLPIISVQNSWEVNHKGADPVKGAGTLAKQLRNTSILGYCECHSSRCLSACSAPVLTQAVAADRHGR